MLREVRRGVYAGPCAIILTAAMFAAAAPVRAASRAVDFDGDGVNESTVVVQVLQTFPPQIRNSIFNNSGRDRLFSWVNAGPGGFTSNALDGGEIRWTWQTAQTVYSFTGQVCRNDLCIFGRDGSRVGEAYGVPGRTVVIGQATTSTAALTSSLIQSFSPGNTLLSCTSSVEQLANGNFAYTTSCANLTGDTLEFEIDAQPLGCCEGTDAQGNPNQIRCEVDVIVDPENPDVTGRESICIDYLTDNDNCGRCGSECLESEVCDEGQCAAVCSEGETWCGGPPHDPDAAECADLLNDPDNCGSCGTSCRPIQSPGGESDSTCVEGQCAICADPDLTRCGNRCVDLETDFENCGACGNDCSVVCPDGGVCVDGLSCECDEAAAMAGAFEATRIASTDAGRRVEGRESTRPERLRESFARVAPTHRTARAETKEGDLPPPAPLCVTAARVLIVPDGETLTECFASPNLPIEAEGQLKACGEGIPEGSPLCGALFGSAGTFQQLEPGMLRPEPVELVLNDVQITDGDNGNGLIEPGDTACFTVALSNAGTETLTNLAATLTSDPIDLECGVIMAVDCEPDGDELAEVLIVSDRSSYPDMGGIDQTDPTNGSCVDANGDPLPAAELTPASNVIPFCVEVPLDHPGDLVRPFDMELTGLDSAGEPFSKQVVFSLGIGSICDFGAGDFPDSVSGPGGPFAGFASIETFPPPAAAETITGGTLFDLTVGLTCGGGPVTDGDTAFGPRIVSLIGDGQGDVTPTDILFAYDDTTGEWKLSFDTTGLAPDTYTLTVRINDVKDYYTTFQLCEDTDADGANDCDETCIDDPDKQLPGACGCGVADDDDDGDGVFTCDACVDEGFECGDCDDANTSTFPGAGEICDGEDNDCDGTVPTDEIDDDGDDVAECEGDCDDDDPTTFSGTEETCDGVDNDCDGTVPADEDDADGDGFRVCAGDCDDTNASSFPEAGEICDGQDNDCDGNVPADEIDDDGDDVTECEGDCDDADPATFDGAPEICDGVDNDCDGTVPADEDDADGDGFRVCAGDCDDANASSFPEAGEICDGQDNDCDGNVPADEIDDDGDDVTECEGDCDDANPATFDGAPETCDGEDNDCDGTVPANEIDDDGDDVTECEGDCNDADPTSFAGATEICDGQDNDCDGTVPADEIDDDGDDVTECEGDCNDADPTSFAGATEICDGQDNDCDGNVPADEIDDDGDGVTECEGDCDDTDPTSFTGATEICDGADNDCDGVSDPDTDQDGTLNCNDGCPLDENKIEPGVCDCGVADTDTDGDGAPDCIDPCGNGVLDPGERCDDGNANDDDGCSNECRLTFDDEACICHRPPGNPGNSMTMCGGGGSIQMHLEHGDTLGRCPDEGDDDDDDYSF